LSVDLELTLQDLEGSILSFIELIISAAIIDADPAGIIANPGKLGLSILSSSFDLAFIVQRYFFFRERRVELDNNAEEDVL
jgi:cystinosin